MHDDQIVPVNYAMSGQIVVIRTAGCTKLFRPPEAKLASELDEYDPPTGGAWSGMVQGIAHDATDSSDDVSSGAAHGADPKPLALGAPDAGFGAPEKMQIWLAHGPNLMRLQSC